MAHRIIIMPETGEKDGARHDAVLKAAADEMLEVAPRFFRVIKSSLMKSIEVPDDVRDLGQSQMWVLHALTRGRHISSELARLHNVTNPTMSRIVDGLVEKGYVERLPDVEDRRCMFLELTDRGRELGREFEQHFREAVVQFLSPLTDEQLDDIRRAHLHLGSLLPSQE